MINKRLATVVIAEGMGYTAGMAYLGFIWYKDRVRTPFHLFDDTRSYLQMDKAGHAYSTYHEVILAYNALRWAGVSKKKALIYGASTGMIIQASIEVFDGLHEGHGCSLSDVAANTFGAALFTVQELFGHEQIFRLKFSYAPSGYPKYYDKLGENHLESFFLDYNAHTYWLSGNIRRITGFSAVPRWLNLAVGYSANGMLGEFENITYYKGKPVPYFDRYRQLLISLDIDFARVKTKNKQLNRALQYLNLFKIPFPAIEFNKNGLEIRPLYF